MSNAAQTPWEPIKELRYIRLHSFDGQDTKSMNTYVIQKKLTNFHNIFYYMKCVVEILDNKTSDFKNKSDISADYFDIMFVLTKRVKEALLDAYNDYAKLRVKEGKAL